MRSTIASIAAAFAACVLSVAAQAQSPGPQGAASREQEWRIPAAGGSALLLTTVYRPRGDGPWPLMVANHGSPAGDPPRYFRNLTDWFVDRGYVVAVPWRRGYGPAGGAIADGMGPCTNPVYLKAGAETASDIMSVVDYLRTQPFVLPTRTIVVGASAGGWGAMALAASNPPGIAGMVSFAGGRGGRCSLPGGHVGVAAPDRLVEGAARYGSTARVPMLWIYAANDSYFNHALARRMADAYTGAGGRAELKLVGAVGEDGHMLVSLRPGLAVWQPLLADFIKGK